MKMSSTRGLAFALLLTIAAGSGYAQPTKFVIQGTGSQTAGVSQNLTIRADSSGVPAKSYTGSKFLTFSGATASPSPATSPTVRDSAGTAVAFGTPTRITFVEGVATVTAGRNGAMTLYRAESAIIAADEGALHTTGADRLSVTVAAAAAAKIAFTTQPGNGTGGLAFSTQPAVTLLDTLGNTVTGAAQDVTLAIQNNAGPGGVLSGTATLAVNTSTGIAAFSGLSIDKAATGYTLTATGNTVSTTPGVVVSNAFNITVGPAAKVAFSTQPSSSTGGVAFPTQPAVTLQDAGGNTVTGTAQSVTLAIQNNAGPGGVLSGTKIVATIAGVATFSGLSIDKAGTGYTLTATGSTVSTTPGVVNSSAFNITAGTATRLVITGQATQTAGLSQNLTITALDAVGNTATGYTGLKSLTFYGASSSANPVTVPTVTNSTGGATNFGTATGITFASGAATVSGGNNGVMKLYKAESTTITVGDGTIVPLLSDGLNVAVSHGSLGQFAFILAPNQTNEVAFTGADTLIAQDDWGNTVTDFLASGNPVTISPQGQIGITLFGNRPDCVLDLDGDFSSGKAVLTNILKYIGISGTLQFKALSQTGSKSGTSGNVTMAPSVARRLVLTGSASLSAGTGNPLTITAKDTSGNTATGYAGAKTLSFTGASAAPNGTTPKVIDNRGNVRDFSGTPNTPITFAAGVASASGGSNGVMRLYKVESATITASDGTIATNGSDRLTVSTTPAGLGSFAVTLTPSQTNGVAFTGVNTVTAIDSFGNTATTFNAATNNVAITTSLTGVVSGLGSGGTNVLNQAGDFGGTGVANLTGKIKYTGTIGTGTFTATSATGGKTGVSGSVAVTVGNATRFVIAGSSTQKAGASQDLTITAKDSSGNTVTTYAGDKYLTFAGSGPSPNLTAPTVSGKNGTAVQFGAPTQIEFIAGLATVTGASNGAMILYRAGRDTISVGDGTISSGGADRLIVQVSQDALYSFNFVLSSPQQSGVVFTGTNSLTAQDRYGNVVTSFSAATDNVRITPNSLTGTISGLGSAGTDVLNQAGDFVNGIATLTGKMRFTGSIGSGTFTANSVTSKSGVSNPVSIVAGGATRLLLTGTATMTAGGSQSLTIVAKDASGNTVTAYTGAKSLLFSGADSSSSPGGRPTVTNSSGTRIPFGDTTSISFSNGAASVSGGSNGVMRLYKTQSVAISVTDGTISSSGSDQLSVTVNPGLLGKFLWNLTSPQTNGVAFTGANTLTAQDDWGNTLTTFDPSGANNVTVTTSAGLPGTVSGLGSGLNNVLNQTNDFVSGVAALSGKLRYTGATGAGTFTANSGGKTGVSASVTISSGSASRLVLRTSLGDSVTTMAAGTSHNLVITAKDASGNTVTTYSGSKPLIFSGADSSLAPATPPTVSNSGGTSIAFGASTAVVFTNGVAQVSGSSNGVLKLYNAQSATISVTDGTNSSAGNDRLTIVVSPAALQKFHWVVTSPQSNAIPFIGINTLTAQDSWGNTLTGFDASVNNVTLSTSLAGSITGLGTGSNSILNRSADFPGGVANLTALGMMYTGAVGRGILTATSAGKGGSSDSIDIAAGGATKLVLTGNPTQTAGTVQGLTITAKDASDNTVTTYVGNKAVTFSGANPSTNPATNPTVTNTTGQAIAFGSSTILNFAAGVATVAGGSNGAMRLYKAESAVISVTDGSIATTGVDRLTVVVSAGPLGQFALNLTSPQTNGVAFVGANSIIAQDDWGNTVTAFNAATDNVTLSTSLPGGTTAITGLGTLGNNVINRAGDFVLGAANLTAMGMKYTGIAGSGTFTATGATSGKTGISAASITMNNPVPTISGVAPVEASRLQQRDAVITGTNFMRGVTVVSFGSNISIDSTIYNSSTQLTVRFTVGAGAALGPRSITVTNPAPGGGAGSLLNGFTVKNLPGILSLLPVSGVRGQTLDVLITGTNFESGVSTVGIQGANITLNSQTVTSPSTISVNISISLSAADGVRQFTVTNSGIFGGTSNTGGFTVGNNPAPTFASITPDTAKRLENREFTLRGSNFYGGITSVNLGPGIAITGTVIDSATQMHVTATITDTATTGKRNIVITNASPGGGTDTLRNTFIVVNPLPTLTGLSAQNGNRLQPVSITLTGTQFVKSVTTANLGAGITIGSTIVDNATQMRVNFIIDSSAALGVRDVSVNNPAPGGGTATLTASFTVSNPTPTITAVSPESTLVGAASQLVTIDGTNFVPGSSARLGPLALTTTLVNRNRISATIPGGELDTARSFTVSVINGTPGGGISNTKNFTVQNPVPTLTGIAPSNGSRLQTLNVVFTGTNFVPGVTLVNFGGTDITVNSVTVTSATQVTANISISALAAIGPRDVTVNNPSPGGGVSGKQTFTIANNPAPTIATVSPAQGNRLGKLDVVITGTNFINGVTSVDFGAGITVTQTTVNSSTQLTARITIAVAAATGLRSVGVTNALPGGGTATKTSAFAVNNPAPTLTDISPTNGQQLQTLNIVFNGTGFISAAVSSVNMGTGITVNSQNVVSDSQMTASVTITTSAATGPRDVYVTNLGPGGGVVALTNGFVVGNNPAPTLTSVTPATARRLEKLDVIFRGTNFIGGVTTVDLGADITVNTPTVDSSGRLTANITVLAAAATGPRTVYLTNAAPGGGRDSLPNGFTVTNPAPTLASITPNAANRQATLNIVLRGSNFLSGTTTLNIGSDIVVNSLTVDSAARMTANITIGSAAATGLRNVFVNNPAPGGGNSGVQTFSVSLAPPPTPTLVSPLNGAPFLPTNPVLRWNAAAGASSYYLQLGTSTLFTNNVLEDSSLTGTSRQVGPLSNGQTYYWRVRAKNSGGISAFSDSWSFRPDYPTILVLSNQVSFPAYNAPGDYKASDWRIVGLPGASTTLISTFMSGTQGTDWQVYTDNGTPGTSGYLAQYNGTSDFTFANGKAFWMIKKNIWTVGVSVDAALLDSSASVRVQLHKGWNLITNPFDKVVPWSSVQSLNTPAAQSPLWAFNGLNGFQQSASLDPFVGYYFYNTDSVAYVRIPYGATSGVMKPDSLENGEWTVAVEARSGLSVDASLSFGTRADAGEGLDRYDFRKPRAMGDMPGAAFVRPDQDPASSAFATDFRPPVEKIARWPFEVRTRPKEQVSLSFAGIGQIPEELEVYLIDAAGSRYTNMRTAAEYRYTPALPAVQFTVAVGTHEAMAAALDDVLPRSFGLENNFPNPFNPSTTIPVAVPHTADLAVTIFNILGEEVRTVFHGTLDAGRYWMTWDGRNDAGRTVATGVYLVRLSAPEGVSVVKKMMMMK